MIEKSLYHEFTTIDEAEAWGEKYYGSWAKNHNKYMQELRQITKMKTCDVIDCYCGYDYRHINSILRNPECNYECKDIYITMSEALAINIVYAPRVPENIIVYRGVRKSFVQDLFHKYKHGWVLDKGFLSTSLLSSIEVDHGFDALLRIYLSKDTPGAYVSCVAGKSEQELRLLPNSFIKLTEKKILTSINKSWEKINGFPVFNCELTYMV